MKCSFLITTLSVIWPSVFNAQTLLETDDGYVMIARHKDVNDGLFAESTKATGVENENDPEANTYSIIGSINYQDYTNDGAYWLRLEFTDFGGSTDTLEWAQESWINEYGVTGANLYGVDAANNNFAVGGGDRFEGLSLSTTEWAYLDGDANSNSKSWNAVITFLLDGPGIPGFLRQTAKSMVLYLKKGVASDPICDAADRTTVDWHDTLNNDEQDVSLLTKYAVDFEASTLSLTFSASVQYVGLSADGNFDDDFNLGTTYWIDFQSFSSVDGVDSAGNCANRRSADYSALSFADFWKYPLNPADLDKVSNEERMAYPPSDWTLNAVNCTAIQYERTMSWTDLTSCQDSAGNDLVVIEDTVDAVKLSGTLFVELLSPYSMSSDEYFRTFPLVQQGFEIVLNKQIDVISSTGTQLFISSVMAYGRDDEGNYEVTVLIQSADFVSMSLDDIAAVTGPLAISDIETVTADCLVASSFTCGQIFTAKIDASCSDDGTVDLSGSYQFGFTPQCRVLDDDGSTDPVCDTFMTTLDDSAGKVALEVDTSFVDQCDVDLFEVTFDGEMAFYLDDQFTVAVDGDSDPFVIGQDTIYGKVTVDIPDDDESAAIFQFVGVSIENIYVCTAVDSADLDVDSDSGLGGCFSSNIDADGPYVVIGTGANADYQGTTDYDVTATNEAAFSFLTFDTPRESINVHVQLLLTMTTESGDRRRRRMLLQSGRANDEGNAFKSYIGTASVQEADEAVTDSDSVEIDGAGHWTVMFIPAMVGVMAWITS